MQLFQLVLDRLLNPPHRVTDAEQIQQSRLLSAVLLVLILFGAFILAMVLNVTSTDINEPEVRGAFLLLGIASIMYVLNRFGYIRIAASGIILPSAVVFTYIPLTYTSKSFFLSFLLIPIILTAMFFRLRWTAFFAAALLAIIFVFISRLDQVSAISPFWNLRNMWFLLILSSGLVVTFVWHLRNIEGIRRTELKRANNQLEEEIAELERFTYTVSHELKSPIITIKGYIGSIDHDLREENYTRAKRDLQRVSTAADKMHDAISDLLELSRIGRIINPPEEIHLANLIEDVLKTMDEQLRLHHITVKIQTDLPVAYMDRVRLREVFENLIDNAVKYIGRPSAPLIEIGTQNKRYETVLFIRDNGIGIEPKYHAKIFGLFDKLDATSEGTGIGLALVKRIIEMQGGRIWVESEGLDKGSTFCFTIPDKRKALSS
jgi:signal transduction histidine kinase